MFGRYLERPTVTRRDRLVTLAAAAALTVIVGAALVGVLVLFARWPLYTFLGLALLWGAGMLVFAMKRARERERETLEQQLRRLRRGG